MPLFQWHVYRSSSQAKSSIGLLKMDVYSGGGMNFNTISLWESKKDMIAFRSSGSHLLAMKLSAKMGKGKTSGWETSEWPSREFCEKRLGSE